MMLRNLTCFENKQHCQIDCMCNYFQFDKFSAYVLIIRKRYAQCASHQTIKFKNLSTSTWYFLRQSKLHKYLSGFLSYSFLGLLAATTYSVKTVYNEYLEEKTYFSKSFEDLSEYDLPTITLCINSQSILNYGIDFNIKMETNDGNQTWLNLHKGDQECSSVFDKVLNASNFQAVHSVRPPESLAFKTWVKANIIFLVCFNIFP